MISYYENFVSLSDYYYEINLKEDYLNTSYYDMCSIITSNYKINVSVIVSDGFNGDFDVSMYAILSFLFRERIIR